MRDAITERLAKKYNNTTMSIISEGVEQFGSVVKVFYNPALEEFQAKCAFFNKPSSYFFKILDRDN